MLEDKMIFVSHAWSDKPRVESLVRFLERLGVATWFDKCQMRGGDDLPEEIKSAISESDTVAVFLSKESVTRPWVHLEINHAYGIEQAEGVRLLVPCYLEDCDPPIVLKDRLYADFRKGVGVGVKALLESTFRDSHVFILEPEPSTPYLPKQQQLKEAVNEIVQSDGRLPKAMIVFDASTLVNEVYYGLSRRYSDTQLESLGKEMRDFVERNQRQLASQLENLSFAVTLAANAGIKCFDSGHGRVARISEVINRTAALCMNGIWKTIHSLLDEDGAKGLECVDGGRAIGWLKELDARVPGNVEKGLVSGVFDVQVEDVVKIGLQAAEPVASHSYSVPRNGVEEAWESISQSMYPCPPSTEILPWNWVDYFVPTILKYHHAWRSNRGELMAKHRQAISISRKDFLHIGKD